MHKIQFRSSFKAWFGKCNKKLLNVIPLPLSTYIYWLIAFAFNAKSFAIAILVFFFLFFFLLVNFSGHTANKLFHQRFMISYQESVWPRSDSLLGHTKMSFRKYCSTSYYSRRVWHVTQVMHGNQHLKYPKKHKKQSARNSETS